VTFGGAATWANVLAFEKILEQGLIVNDGSFGWACDPTSETNGSKYRKSQRIRHFSGKTRAMTTRSVASTVGAQSARLSYHPAK
jgi:hypothetical protein